MVSASRTEHQYWSRLSWLGVHCWEMRFQGKKPGCSLPAGKGQSAAQLLSVLLLLPWVTSEAVGCIIASVRPESSHILILVYIYPLWWEWTCLKSLCFNNPEDFFKCKAACGLYEVSHWTWCQDLVQQILLKLSSCQCCFCSARGSSRVWETLSCRASPEEQQVGSAIEFLKGLQKVPEDTDTLN